MPLVFANEADWSKAEVGQRWRITALTAALKGSARTIHAQVEGLASVPLELQLSPGERAVLSAGGLLASTLGGSRNMLTSERET